MSKVDADEPTGSRERGAEAALPEPSTPGKRRYRTPALIRYGTLAEVTGNMAAGSVADAMAMLMMM
jgi:hypothetical protein